MRKLRPATKAWVGLTAYVVIADTYLIYQETKHREGYCTMSTAFEDALRHPAKRWPVSISWALLTLHLFDLVLPEKLKPYEPITGIGRLVTERLRRDSDLFEGDEVLWFVGA